MQDLITENNLDRFDTTSLTWKHPNLSEHRLIELFIRMLSTIFDNGTRDRNVWDVTTRNGRGSAREREQVVLRCQLLYVSVLGVEPIRCPEESCESKLTVLET